MFNYIKTEKMKKSFIIVSMTALFIMGLVACNDAPKIDEFVGKWNMTNDEESSIQKTMELKEDHSFVETWTVYNEDGEEYAGLKIEGEYEIEITEDYFQALCWHYNLASLSDPDNVLEELDMGDYFKNENKEYEDAKREHKIYGLQQVRVEKSMEGTSISFRDDNAEPTSKLSNVGKGQWPKVE